MAMLIDADIAWPGLSRAHPETGCRYTGEMPPHWLYAEIGPNGEVLAQGTREMVLRWTYRWERHYFWLYGFDFEAKYADFGRAAPAYG